MNLGTLLRRHRKEQGLTLRLLAQKAGVSEGFLSQVENNVKAPSIETLFHICEALSLPAGDLLNQVKNQDRLFLFKQSEWTDVEVPHTGFATRRFCSPENRAVIDSALLFLEPGKSLPVRKGIKNGQEVICVLRGALTLRHQDRIVVLAAGDTVHLWSVPDRQSITNKGSETAVALWIGTL